MEMILPSLIAAGMEMVTARLALSLAERGWTVGVTCLMEDGILADGLRQAGIAVRTVPEPGFEGNLWPRRLEAALRERRPDVVHVHSGAWIKGAHAARRAGVPRVVFTEHGLLAREPWYNRWLKRWGAWYCDKVVAVSEPLAVYLQRVGIPVRKLAVVPNGVDTRRFAPGPATGALRQACGIGAAPLIGHVARLSPEKNQQSLLDAFALVRRHLPQAQLAIAGDGPLRADLEQRAAALGVAEQVHFVGVYRDMEQFYRDIDLFVLPSLAEGTSMSVLEAMASGCAIVASAVGGTPALLDGGTCGVLVEPTDTAALASALSDLLGAPERRRALGEAARHRAVTAYAEARMVDAYVELYGVDRGARTKEPHACAV